MSDIFREVDEDLRREQFKTIFNKYGVYIIAVAVLIVVGVAGWRAWGYFEARRAAADGDRFIAAMNLLEEGKNAEAGTAFEAIAAESSGRYPSLARLAGAGVKVVTGDTAGAVAAFDSVANDSSAPDMLRTIASLRAAYLLVDTADKAEMERRVGGLAAPGQPYSAIANEILGLTAWRAADLAEAKKRFEAVTADQRAPVNVRDRARLMLQLIAGRSAAPAAEAAPAASTQ